MNITIPGLSLVVLIGASGSGKSTFARANFKPTEILCSDYFRGLVSDDENSLTATGDAFEVLHFVAAKRLAAGKLVVVDATNVQREARAPLVALARRYHCLPVAIVLDMPEALCRARNSARPDRNFGPHVVRNHVRSLRQSMRGLRREGFRHIFEIDSPEQASAVQITREPLYSHRQQLTGPFDIIGDIHGCFDELTQLLTNLGYAFSEDGGSPVATPPEGRMAVFLGDLVDRGPNSPGVLRLVMNMVSVGSALCVPGNHDIKLQRKLNGKDVTISHGLAETLEQLEREPADFIERVKVFLDGLTSHFVLDGGRLVVAHAGMKEEMQGRGSGEVRSFALYGETTGETDDFGLPVRYNWAKEYRGGAAVVYGHTPMPAAEWLNNTINIDTGCVFGGSLTALRWPERCIVSVAAARMYAEPARPFLPAEGESLSSQQIDDGMLDIADVTGKRFISTSLRGTITIQDGNAAAALEVMSRFAADPRWLIYLPPTMSPSETTQRDGLLEHPTEAFAYFRQAEALEVVCQEKHMGSRAVMIVCKDERTAIRRFGVEGGTTGICYTRTGRRFFDKDALESDLLEIVRSAATRAGVWEELQTDWLALDCELMPWSAKAQELLRRQYAAVGAASKAALAAVSTTLQLTAARGIEVDSLCDAFARRGKMAGRFVDAYRRYCWPVAGLSDLKLAPFHLLASEGCAYTDKDHAWHMAWIGRMCDAADGVLVKTPVLEVDLADSESEAAGAAWWEELTAAGGEGMVVKPRAFVTRHGAELVQPAVKCRGREYLRIIYGPEYSAPENLSRLRSRGLGRKRSLALREFALGIEGLERFIRHEPLRRVHECVFGVLALETEPVDPRL